MNKQEKFSGLTSKLGLEPKEATQQIQKGSDKLFIGIPKERTFQEHRVCLTPENVRILVNNGHHLVVETGAGNEAFFKDRDYSEAGAQIAYSMKEVYEAEIIMKVTPPTLEEIELMKPGSVLFSPIHLPTLKEEIIQKLMAKKITAIAFEYLKDVAGSYPFVRSMSEIAGSSVILIAAEYLSNISQGKGMLLGGIAGVPPSKVVILGAGVVGTYAAKAAIGLGAQVTVFDNNVYKLMRLQSHLGVRVFTSVLSPAILDAELKTADVLIGAIHSGSGRTLILVTEEMVSHMKPGSVVIDVSIDQGGCIETSEVTTHNNPIVIKNDVIHYGVPNIPSRVSRTASEAISNILTPILINAQKLGGIKNLISQDNGTRHGVYIYGGSMVNVYLAERFGIKMSNLDILFSKDLL